MLFCGTLASGPLALPTRLCTCAALVYAAGFSGANRLSHPENHPGRDTAYGSRLTDHGSRVRVSPRHPLSKNGCEITITTALGQLAEVLGVCATPTVGCDVLSEEGVK